MSSSQGLSATFGEGFQTEFRRQGLVSEGRQGLAQSLALSAVGRESGLFFRVGVQIAPHCGVPALFERAVKKGMKLVFANRAVGGHLTLLRCDLTGAPSARAAARRARPRERRDMTVPSGTPRTRAASA